MLDVMYQHVYVKTTLEEEYAINLLPTSSTIIYNENWHFANTKPNNARLRILKWFLWYDLLKIATIMQLISQYITYFLCLITISFPS